jgi:hypothetical protein
LHTIEPNAVIALAEIVRLSQRYLDGKHLDIRKNPHVIDVGSKQNMQGSC